MSTIIKSYIFNFAYNKIYNSKGTPPDDAFFVMDIQDLIDKQNDWINKFPRIRSYYAVKVNNAQIILEILSGLGLGFDCASKAEIEQVIGLGVDPQKDIIYANPCKSESHLKYASSVGTDLMTFDNEYELKKIADHCPNARLVLRIKVNDNNSAYPLGSKFGVQLKNVKKLLHAAIQLNLRVIGVSFHVGCRCSDQSNYSNAIADAKEVFRIAKDEFNYEMTLLDIGGGFPGTSWHSGPGNENMFDRIAHAVNQSLDVHFPIIDYPNLEIISEPGTYYSASAFYLSVKIIAKRVDEEEDNGKTKLINYYVNEGVFGSFLSIPFHFSVILPKPLLLDTELNTRELCRTTIWGQTCDSNDYILKEVLLPEMNIGEWLLFKDLGDYTLTLHTQFNGYSATGLMYCAESHTQHVLEKLKTWPLIERRLNMRNETQSQYMEIRKL